MVVKINESLHVELKCDGHRTNLVAWWLTNKLSDTWRRLKAYMIYMMYLQLSKHKICVKEIQQKSSQKY